MMYIDLTSNLSNINIYIILSILGIGTGYFCGSVSNSYLLVKIAYAVALLIIVSHSPTKLFVVAGLVFGYFYSKRQGFFDVSDWWAGYRYKRAIRAEEMARREAQRDREQTEEFNRRRERERRRREDEQQRERAERSQQDPKQGKSSQAEPPRSHEQAKREEELRKAEAGLRKKQEAMEEVIRRAYEQGKQHGQQQQAQKDTRTPEEVLGLQPGYTKEELRRAYKAHCQRLHPDKWQDRPPHIQEAMEEEQKRVNWAYGVLEKRFELFD